MNYLICFIFFFSLNAVSYSQSDSVAEIANEKKWEVNGYVKNLSGMFFYPDNSYSQWNLIHNRVNVRWNPVLNLTAAFELRNRILYGDAVQNGMYPSVALDRDKGIVDLTFLPFDTRFAKMVTSVERLWLRYNYKMLEFTVGRQRINWGVNLVWNPNDIFNTYSFIDFDYEERPGSDAVRLKIRTGEMSDLEIAAKPGRSKNTGVYALMFKTNKVGYDFQFLGGVYENDIALGTGWAGNIWKLGFKGEATYFHPLKGFKDSAGVVNAAVEFDYTVNGKVYMNASYLLNSKGLKKPDARAAQLLNSADVTARFLSPSMHSLFLQFKTIFSPVFSVSLSGIYFFGIDGIYIFPSVTYSVNESWEVSLFAQTYWQRETSILNKMNNILLRMKYSF